MKQPGFYKASTAFNNTTNLIINNVHVLLVFRTALIHSGLRGKH